MIEKTLDGLCAELRNYFVKKIYSGTFTVSGGSITLGGIAANQYICIVGSVFNDGVHKYPLTGLVDETFTGEIWAMAVPPSVIALAADIEKYCKSDEAQPSAFTSESFGGYSYTKATGADGTPLSWEQVFAKRLNKWRKIMV